MVPLKKIKCYFSFISSVNTTLACWTSCFCNPEVTTGASNDFGKLPNIAQMVTRYGMSNIGLALKVIIMQMYLGGEYNEAIADRIDTEVCKINHCEQIARKFLDNRVVIDLAVEIIRCRNIDGRIP
jgi:ATP-dependent Zn protease